MAHRIRDAYQHLTGNSRKARYNEALTRRKTRQLEKLAIENQALIDANTETQGNLDSMTNLAAHLQYTMSTHVKDILKMPGLRQMDVIAVNQSGLIYGQSARSRKKHGNLVDSTLKRFNYNSKEQTAYINGEFCTVVLETATNIKGKKHSFGYIKKAPAEARFKRAVAHGGQELTDAIDQVVEVIHAKVDAHVYQKP